MRTRSLSPALLCLLLGLAACEQKAAEGGGRGAVFSRGPTLVVAEPAALRDIREEVEAIGTTLANESVTITAQVTDTVSRVVFDDGDYVDQGDVLVQLTSEEEAALLAEAEINLDDARNQYRRLENLLEDGSIPVSEVDQARARYSAAEARYQSVVARLDDRLVKAPFSGLLGFRKVSPGTLVSPGTNITTLDDISVIKLDFSIPEVLLSLVEPGMRLNAESSAFPGTFFDATVRTIGSRIDEISRAATVRAIIDNSSLLLRPGMLLTVRLTTAERRALMVPESALIQRSSQAYVYTIDGAQAALTQVISGARFDGWVEILDGLDPGQAVVAEGVIKIRDGSPVVTSPAEMISNDARPERAPSRPSPGR